MSQRLNGGEENCAVYIYGTLEEAKNGDFVGGSGFLVGVPIVEGEIDVQLYVVTNRHVIKKYNRPVIRLNRADGTSSECLDTNKNRWVESGHDDLAVFPLLVEESDYDLVYIHVANFITRESIAKLNIGPGDDVFMVGRFISHEGKQRNAPAVRFGNIAMDAKETMTNEYGKEQETFLVDCRSVPGYSGSPVFVLLDPLLPRPPEFLQPRKFVRSALKAEDDPIDNPRRIDISLPSYHPNVHGPWLLGVDWVHITNCSPILKSDRKTKVTPHKWVELNTGMAGVIPAWRLRELLYSPELEMQRKKTAQHIAGMRSQTKSDATGNEPETLHVDFNNNKAKLDRK